MRSGSPAPECRTRRHDWCACIRPCAATRPRLGGRAPASAASAPSRAPRFCEPMAGLPTARAMASSSASAGATGIDPEQSADAPVEDLATAARPPTRANTIEIAHVIMHRFARCCGRGSAMSCDEHVFERRRHRTDRSSADAGGSQRRASDPRVGESCVASADVSASPNTCTSRTPGSAAQRDRRRSRRAIDDFEQTARERAAAASPGRSSASSCPRAAAPPARSAPPRRDTASPSDGDAAARGTPTAASRTRVAIPGRRRSSVRRAADSCGSWTSVQASASFCFIPPDSRSARRRAERRELRHVSSRSRAGAVVTHAVDLGEERDVLVDGQVAVETESLRQIADSAVTTRCSRTGSRPRTRNRAGIAAEQSAHQTDRGRLAGAVRPDEPEHLARRDFEATSRRPRRSLPYRLGRRDRSRGCAASEVARALAQFGFDRHARFQHAVAVVDGDLDPIDELRPLVSGLHVPRCELGLRRDEGDRPVEPLPRRR